jgi:hypothetical protein
MNKDRMGLVSSQKKGQVVVVNNGSRHLTRLLVDGWVDDETRKTRRGMGMQDLSTVFTHTLLHCHRDSIGHCALWISS